ncbi:dTDP-4-dehydrorhamnose 3,5-epimerase family protein [Corynebacterium heidelbergense]|uniref:dTDP-4-dehydrorhamnose 3,5-epimerase n=1 Tax=Corynebacterium heidelbergense TaxID=2055947 RepID=A0A364V9F9_9CORY|nr:dTDP-4-dehydrorhamnose 3,5-epimerase [Corynebacterium heidelbergense]RAV33248.1 dTDP-4-dehydrorhamnose 3,5-epimerase [Corynebacterium heidelbergense]WCZ37379.1 dTDP-4-dehydrorhamnose 3,5-epimerase [Corynebacterium heidelbergense]
MTNGGQQLELPELRRAGGITELPIAGAWVFSPRIHGDERGSFAEWFRADECAEKLGYPFEIAQANISHSKRAVVRGIHLAEVPPGQAKFVTCVAGEVNDVLVDVRRGSPTYGKHISIPLSAATVRAVFVPVGVGHGFTAISDTATVTYLVNEAYNPRREFEINAFDAALGIEWGVDAADAVRSDKDVNAPLLAEVTQRLPQWRECRGWEQQLRSEWEDALAHADAYEGEPEGGVGR